MTIDWNEKASKTFAQYDIDVQTKFEKKSEPNVNIRSLAELLSDD